jgi:hypothetical protein
MRQRGAPVVPAPLISYEALNPRKRREACQYFNQEVQRRYDAARERLQARGEELAGSPWTPILDEEGNPQLNEDGEPQEEFIQFFPLPFLEVNKSGYIFSPYKNRFACHAGNMLIRMGTARGLFKEQPYQPLFRCAGMPA